MVSFPYHGVLPFVHIGSTKWDPVAIVMHKRPMNIETTSTPFYHGQSAVKPLPKPPGSEGDEPPPAGTALAPPVGVTG